MDEEAKERAREQGELMAELLNAYIFGSKQQERMPVYIESMMLQSLGSIITYINTGKKSLIETVRQAKEIFDAWLYVNGGAR